MTQRGCVQRAVARFTAQRFAALRMDTASQRSTRTSMRTLPKSSRRCDCSLEGLVELTVVTFEAIPPPPKTAGNRAWITMVPRLSQTSWWFARVPGCIVLPSRPNGRLLRAGHLEQLNPTRIVTSVQFCWQRAGSLSVTNDFSGSSMAPDLAPLRRGCERLAEDTGRPYRSNICVDAPPDGSRWGSERMTVQRPVARSCRLRS
jgi:hypothetical protein